MPIDEAERLRRWELILRSGVGHPLSGEDHQKAALLAKLYNRHMLQRMGLKRQGFSGRGRHAGLEGSMPDVSRWLGDIREYFPETVVQIMQQDAIDALGLPALLDDPEILAQLQPDVNLAGILLMLKEVIPTQTRESARFLVKRVVDDLMKRLESPMRQAIYGALNRANRTRRPRHHDIDWHRTIRMNLKHYQEDYKTIIPETLIGFGRRKKENRHQIIICIDQSGSMAASIVYSSIFGAVMASIPSVKTHLVVFDTSVVDMTPYLHDPVELLFGTTLGGGTNINQAVEYCQSLIESPKDTTFVLISDLIEGGNQDQLLQRIQTLVQNQVRFVALLALSDLGTPEYSGDLAAQISALGGIAFSCTPDLFPELMAATMNKGDLRDWAKRHEVRLAGDAN